MQDSLSTNHPQGTASPPKVLPQVRLLAGEAGEGYWSVWASDRSDLVSRIR